VLDEARDVVRRARDRALETADGWPTGREMVTQLREALGLFTGAMPRPPQKVWEEALAEVRRLRAENETLRHQHEVLQEILAARPDLDASLGEEWRRRTGA